MLPDISEIGEFSYSWDFDKEDYFEYLKENELQNNEETLKEYIEDNVTFFMEFLDNETYHVFEHESMTLGEISDNFGETLANRVLSDCMKEDEGRIEACLIVDNNIDVNNDAELNDVAKKLLQNGDYYKDCRGFILTDGTVVYTPNEHNQCTIIDGIKDTFHFISLGNIRVLPNSIDIGKVPTQAQRDVLMRVINSYSDEELYLDIMDKGTEFGAKYNHPNWKYVMAEIDRYYREGIKPGSNAFHESKKKRGGKTIIISEEKEQELISEILTESFIPSAEKVLVIKKYIDDNFAKQELDSLDDNGYPIKEKTVVLLSKDKQGLKTLNMKEFLRMLDDKFNYMIKDDSDRKKFLKQVIKDWYYNKIQKNGILSVNHL